MELFFSTIERYRRAIIVAVFSLFLLGGLYIVPDMPADWDELANRRYGANSIAMAQRFLETGNPVIGSARGLEHGTGYQMILYGAEILFGFSEPADLREIYLLRHYLNFLLFFGAGFCFFLTCRLYFKNSWLALFGFLLFFTHPRIFNHSFHNSSDIGFLSLCTISVYFIFKMVDERRLGIAVIAAFFSALATDTRAPGVMFIGLGCAAIVANGWKCRRELSFRGNLLLLLTYAASSWFFIVLLWPFLWGNAVENFIWALGGMSRLDFSTNMIYLGHSIKSTHVPRSYNLVWIFVTTPLLILGLVGLGHLGVMWNVLRNFSATLWDEKLTILIASGWVPLIAPAILRSTLFDEWRHHFFIYPAIVFFAIYGLKFAMERFSSLRWYGRAWASVAVVVVGLNIVSLVSLHPYQNLYFSLGYDLVSDSTTPRGTKFDVDYWGMTYREGLEFLVNSNDGMVKVAGNRPIAMNWAILPREKSSRVELVGEVGCDYWMSTYRNSLREYQESEGEEVYAKYYRGTKVLTVRRCVK